VGLAVIAKDKQLGDLRAARSEIQILRKCLIESDFRNHAKQRELSDVRGGLSALRGLRERAEGSIKAARKALVDGETSWSDEKERVKTNLQRMREKLEAAESSFQKSLLSGVVQAAEGTPGSGDLTEEQEALAREDIMRLDEAIKYEEAICRELFTKTEELKSVLGAICIRGGHPTVEAMVAWVLEEGVFAHNAVGNCALLHSSITREEDVLKRVGVIMSSIGREAEEVRERRAAEKMKLENELEEVEREVANTREKRIPTIKTLLADLTGKFICLRGELGGKGDGWRGNTSLPPPSTPLSRGALEELLGDCESYARKLLHLGAELLMSARMRRAAKDAVMALEARKGIVGKGISETLSTALDNFRFTPRGGRRSLDDDLKTGSFTKSLTEGVLRLPELPCACGPLDEEEEEKKRGGGFEAVSSYPSFSSHPFSSLKSPHTEGVAALEMGWSEWSILEELNEGTNKLVAPLGDDLRASPLASKFLNSLSSPTPAPINSMFVSNLAKPKLAKDLVHKEAPLRISDSPKTQLNVAHPANSTAPMSHTIKVHTNTSVSVSHFTLGVGNRRTTSKIDSYIMDAIKEKEEGVAYLAALALASFKPI